MRKTLLLLCGFSLALTGLEVEAGWLTAARRDFYRSHYRSHCWPYPYNLMDQQAVRSPFQMMVENGWQARNTIRHEHFDPGTEKLNAAGRGHIRWILANVPEARRILFVQPAESSRQTAQRLAAVQHVTRLAEKETGIEVVLATVVSPAAISPKAGQSGTHSKSAIVAPDWLASPLLPSTRSADSGSEGKLRK